VSEKTLYIGDVNRILQPITSAGSNVSNETVTFTVRSSKSFTGTAVGTANNAMAWDAAATWTDAGGTARTGAYVANWTQSESDDLVEGRMYWVHIVTVSHGQRLVPCLAKYREDV
jgi:hypothetical protein